MIRFFLCCVLMVLIGCDDDSCSHPFFSGCPDMVEECSEDTICPEGYECQVIGDDTCVEVY